MNTRILNNRKEKSIKSKNKKGKENHRNGKKSIIKNIYNYMNAIQINDRKKENRVSSMNGIQANNKIQKMHRKDRIKKTVCYLTCVIICFALAVTDVQANAKKNKNKNKNYWPKQSEKLVAKSALLMDLDTGTILYQKNIEQKYYPASITKILTALIAIEKSEMDEVVTFSADAVYKTKGGSSISRDIGEKMTMEECLYALMLESANECAYAVAEHVGGSIKKFVKMMNDKAKELGCTSSNFANPHGLTNKKHYVTAKDMALIAKAAYENETFRLICGTKQYTIPPTNKHKENTYLTNHHLMLYPRDTAAYLYEYCIGGKTGYTVAAGSTLVTYAQKDGMSLVAVILSSSSPEYWNETRSLFDFGFENFHLCNVAKYIRKDESYLENEDKYDSLNTNEPYAQIDPQARVILPKTVDFGKTTFEASYENLPENVLARLTYMYGKHEIGTADIVRTKAEIDPMGSMATNTASAELEEGENKKKDKDNSKEEQASKGKENKEETVDKDADENSFHIKQFFLGMPDFLRNIGNIFLENPWMIYTSISIIVLLIIIVTGSVVFNRSYVLRQKIANRRNKKRERRQYITIRETRKSKGKRRKKR